MSREMMIAQAKVVLDPIMGAMQVDNVDQYKGVNACLIEFGNPVGRVDRIRVNLGYDEQRMLAWGAAAVAERGGNCDDFAAAVCYLLNHSGFFGKIEHVQAPGHAFVVINRNGSGDINVAGSWTEETFIIDYWLNCRAYTKRVETVHVPADLLCNIPEHKEQRIVSTSTSMINHYITDLSTQPGLWYAGHRKNGELRSMTTITPF